MAPVDTTNKNRVKHVNKFLQKSFWRLQSLKDLVHRKTWLCPVLRLRGMLIGRGTIMTSPRISWPHKVSLGKHCIIERGVIFKHDGIWSPGVSIRIGNEVFIGDGCEFNIRKGITIGDSSLIASGCRFIDHDHGVQSGSLIRSQAGPEREIRIGRDVWLGCNVVILKGVYIGDGAVVGAGAVVTKSIPSGEIWAGIPARGIGNRPE
jgi:acetyltransferase-like isoleucine patch superfamily enzyme